MSANPEKTQVVLGETEQGPALIPFRNYAEQGRSIGVLTLENEKIKAEASTDPLTTALNRRGLKDYLATADAPKGLLLVDATNFKAVNDKFNHEFGDQVIRNTYNILRTSTRDEDVIVRWGGDEFVVVLNGDEIQEGRRTGEQRSPEDVIEGAKDRIKSEVKDLLEQYPELKVINFDLSVGGVVWDGTAKIDTLVDRAERLMKKDKEVQHQSGQYRKA